MVARVVDAADLREAEEEVVGGLLPVAVGGDVDAEVGVGRPLLLPILSNNSSSSNKVSSKMRVGNSRRRRAALAVKRPRLDEVVEVAVVAAALAVAAEAERERSTLALTASSSPWMVKSSPRTSGSRTILS